MKNLFLSFALAVLALCSNRAEAYNSAANIAVSRSINTCADPGLTSIYVTSFDPSRTTHIIQPRIYLIDADTATTGGEWRWQGDNFRAWESAQPFTVPLYLFFNPTTTDYSFILSTSGSAPTPGGGLQSQGIRAYVYTSQVCGSVPLYAIAQTSVGDHWYTTNANERDSLVGGGWTDLGILAYVMPLVSDNNCTCSF